MNLSFLGFFHLIPYLRANPFSYDLPGSVFFKNSNTRTGSHMSWYIYTLAVRFSLSAVTTEDVLSPEKTNNQCTHAWLWKKIFISGALTSVNAGKWYRVMLCWDVSTCTKEHQRNNRPRCFGAGCNLLMCFGFNTYTGSSLTMTVGLVTFLGYHTVECWHGLLVIQGYSCSQNIHNYWWHYQRLVWSFLLKSNSKLERCLT